MTSSKWRQQFTLALPSSDLRGRVWVHACSVGEVSSVASLIHRLLEHGQQVHLTMVTRTGYAHAERLFGDKISKSWLPWDLPTFMPRFIKRLQPSMLLLCETEFWPGMLKTCKHQHIPVIGINTRISDRSFPKYHATRFLWQRWLKPVSMFLAQSEQDAERLHAIGVEKSKIKAVGNLKFAVQAPDVDSQSVRQFIDPSATRPILVIASTHEDEEAQIIPLLNTWKHICPELLTLIVPRHPERFKHVAKLLQDSATAFTRFAEERTGSEDVILIDAMGELTRLYTIADLVFIGGSLAPIGGHNPLEAAVCDRGVITGPHVQNFRAVMVEMQNQGSAILVQNKAELESVVSRLLQHPDELQQLHASAALFMHDQHQVLDRMWSEIKPFLKEKNR
ncbi:MAG: 3-deoxy-D-manno-octulosonic acid transferase [Ghiorsea sp.]